MKDKLKNLQDLINKIQQIIEDFVCNNWKLV